MKAIQAHAIPPSLPARRLDWRIFLLALGMFVLYDFTGELHRRYEAEQGGVVVIRPDGSIGFWEQLGVTDALRHYAQKLFCQQKEMMC